MNHLVGEFWHTVAPHIHRDLGMSWLLHLEGQPLLRVFHYLQMPTARKKKSRTVIPFFFNRKLSIEWTDKT